MATPVDKNATRTTVSVSAPAYKVAVGGAPRGKPPRRYIVSSTTQKTVIEEYRVVPRYLRPSTGSCHDSCKNANDEWKELKTTRNLGPRRKYAMTTSRYLSPSPGSCHDSCKHGKKDNSMELRTTRTLASRKRSVTKNNGVKRTVVSVERKKITEIKPKPPRGPKIRTLSEPVKVIKVKNSLPSKKGAKKPMTVNLSSSTLKNKKVTKITPKNKINKPASPQVDQNEMTKTTLGLMIADKIQEMVLQEAETTAELVDVEETIDQSPETLTTESINLQNDEDSSSESIILQNDEDSSSEICESSSNEQVSNSEPVDDEVCDEELLEEEFEYDEEGYILEEDEDGDEEKKGRRYRVVRSEEDDGPSVKFRRGKVLEVDGEDGPRKLKFKAGTVVDGGEEEESEKVNLKHQEVGKKEAQELLNNVIEETASKLVEDMKTKVGALVGAFETVISRQDETPATS